MFSAKSRCFNFPDNKTQFEHILKVFGSELRECETKSWESKLPRNPERNPDWNRRGSGKGSARKSRSRLRKQHVIGPMSMGLSLCMPIGVGLSVELVVKSGTGEVLSLT